MLLHDRILLNVGTFSELNMIYSGGMNPHFITWAFLLLAVGLYFSGMALSATVFLVLGGIAESVRCVSIN